MTNDERILYLTKLRSDQYRIIFNAREIIETTKTVEETEQAENMIKEAQDEIKEIDSQLKQIRTDISARGSFAEKDSVFRNWWNRKDPERRFMIGFGRYREMGQQNLIIIDSYNQEVHFQVNQLEELIIALTHVRDTIDEEGERVPYFDRPKQQSVT